MNKDLISTESTKVIGIKTTNVTVPKEKTLSGIETSTLIDSNTINNKSNNSNSINEEDTCSEHKKEACKKGTDVPTPLHKTYIDNASSEGISTNSYVINDNNYVDVGIKDENKELDESKELIQDN